MTETDKIRIKVLNYSLKLEKAASYILGFILDIKDYNDSKSFGNKSTSLSFNQKINLLLDYGAIEKEDKIILDASMNIRNQFMHNLNCTTYQDAFNCIDGLENKLRKLYTGNFENEDNEINLSKCVDAIFDDSYQIITSLKGGVDKKIQFITENKVFEQAILLYLKVGREKFLEITAEIFEERIDFHDKKVLIARLVKLNKDILDESVKGINVKFEKLEIK